MNPIDLEVKGMTCGACVDHVTQALQAVAGVKEVKVDLGSNHVLVSGEFSQGINPLISSLSEAGYPAKLAGAPAPLPQPGQSGCGNKNSTGGCCCG